MQINTVQNKCELLEFAHPAPWHHFTVSFTVTVDEFEFFCYYFVFTYWRGGWGCKWGGNVVHIVIMCDYSNILLINLILTIEWLLTLDSETEIDLLFFCWRLFFHHLWFDWLGLNAYLEGATPPPSVPPEDNWVVAHNIMWLMSPQGLEHWIFGWAEWWWDYAAIATPKGRWWQVRHCDLVYFIFSFFAVAFHFFCACPSDCDYVWYNICWVE